MVCKTARRSKTAPPIGVYLPVIQTLNRLSTLNDVIQTLNTHQHLAQTLSEWTFVESQQHEPSEQREHGLEGVQHLLGNIA